jgi:soluble lytic murein transglycosylase
MAAREYNKVMSAGIPAPCFMRKCLFFFFFFFLFITAFATILNTRYPIRYADIIEKHAGQLDIPLLYSVIKTESGFRPLVQSHRGASGLMQLTDATAKWMAGHMGLDFRPEDVWEPETNIKIGSYFLNWLVVHYEGDMTLVLCAYNAGMGNVAQWLADSRYSSDGRTLHTIPFPETEQYVKRVIFNQRIYEILLAIRRIN